MTAPICRKCGATIAPVRDNVWMVVNTNTTGDGLTYCPPNPDHTGRFGEHVPTKENRGQKRD